MAVPKRRTSTTRKNKRRTHIGLKLPNMNACRTCGELKRNHYVCSTCGHYDKADVLKKEV